MPLTSNITNPGCIFPNWVPMTDGFGYEGSGNELRYTGQWLAPYSTDTLQKALALIDFKDRFAAASTANATNPSPSYTYKEQIEQTLLPSLTSQRMRIKPTNTYQPYALTSNVSSDGIWNGQANATNVLQNAASCVVNIEWLLKPINVFGINCAFVTVNGSGDFQEMGTDRTCLIPKDTSGNDLPGKSGVSVITANTASNTTGKQALSPLSKGYTLVEPKDTIVVEYPWVDAALVDQLAMRALRGRINLADILQWFAGTLLYESSDVESSYSPLGYPGYKVKHYFVGRDRDWNLVPTLPSTLGNTTSNSSTSWENVSFSWATFRPPMVTANGTNNTTTVYPNLTDNNNFSSYLNRIYQYQPFATAKTGTAISKLFYYGFDLNAAWYSPPVNSLA